MDNNSFQTSFIPKKPIAVAGAHEVPLHRPIRILLPISLIILFITAGLYGGLYLYKGKLLKEIDSSKASFSAVEKNFEPAKIQDLEAFNKKVGISKKLLASHVALSPLFYAINEITIPTVQFTKFSAENSVSAKNIDVKISGIARDYKSIAIQSQAFNDPNMAKYFKNVIFSKLVLSENKDTKGYVTFDLSFSVDPNLLSYEKKILQSKVAPASKQTNTTMPSGLTDTLLLDENINDQVQ